jgi:hypothetical protein
VGAAGMPMAEVSCRRSGLLCMAKNDVYTLPVGDGDFQ